LLRFDRSFHGLVEAGFVRALGQPLFFLRDEVSHPATFLRVLER